jgi:N-acetylmuramoyl-L-alanine amidase
MLSDLMCIDFWRIGVDKKQTNKIITLFCFALNLHYLCPELTSEKIRMRRNGRLISILVFLFLWMSGYAADSVFTVVIDAGHGGRDPGAVGSIVREKVINLSVAKKLGALITTNHKDVKVIYTRETDVFVELSERADIANRNKADLFISIHTNSLDRRRSNVRGAETYTLGLARTEENLEVAMRENAVILEEENYLQRYSGFDPNSTESYIMFEFMQNMNMEHSVDFASEIQKAFTSAKRINRGVKQAGFMVLGLTGMPGVLVELGFLSNKDEEKYLNSNEGQNQLARAIYTAFNSYKGKYGSKQTITASNTNTSTVRTTNSSVTENSNEEGLIIYKVQILSSNNQLPANSPSLKGYEADWYKDGNLYKYTYGESTDLRTIQELQKKVKQDFKDAFIIQMKDGRRVN